MSPAPVNNPGHFDAGAQFDIIDKPERKCPSAFGKTSKPSRRDWVEAIDAEWRRGLSGWHLSLLALQSWLRAMEKLHRLERRRDGD